MVYATGGCWRLRDLLLYLPYSSTSGKLDVGRALCRHNSSKHGSEKTAVQEQVGSFPSECRCWRGFCGAQHISLGHWTSESSSCFASGLQMWPLKPKCRPGKPDLRRYLDPSITWDDHCLLAVVAGRWAVGKLSRSQQHLLMSPPRQGVTRISSVAGDKRQNRRS